MDVQTAMAALPEPYVAALRAVLSGQSEEALAAALDVPVEASRNVVRLALAKFAALLNEVVV